MASKKEKDHVILPNAWKSAKNKGDSSRSGSGSNDAFNALGSILAVFVVLFIALGGISQTGAIRFVSNWSHTVGEKISNWLEGGSIVTNEDGVYWDPTGQKGTKIGDPDAPEVETITIGE